MKKIFYTVALSMLCMILSYSCTKEEQDSSVIDGGTELPEGYEKITLSATCDPGDDAEGEETDGGSRTTWSGNQTLWQSGDQIKVYYSSSSSDFTLTSGAGTRNGLFSGAASSAPEYAVYPAGVSSSRSGSTVSVTIPATQTGTFGSGNIATAKVDGSKNMSFANVNAFISITTTAAIHHIVVTSVSGGALAGTVPVSYASGSADYGAATSTASSIRLNTNSTAGTYYISIVPGVTHSEGLTIAYYTAENTLSNTYYLRKSVVATRNKIIEMGSFVPDGKNYYVTTSGAGNGSGISWANAMSGAKLKTLVTPDDDDSKQDAKIAAINGATFHMAAGTYDFGEDPTISFNETNPVTITLKGGYPAGGGTRNIASNSTIITGNRNDSASPVTGHHCLDLSGKMNVTLDGLHFENGLADDQYSDGALHCTGSNLSLTMVDCTVSNNKHIYNGADKDGAGLFLKDVGGFTATRVVFSDNTSLHAPALYCNNTDMTLSQCQFNSNSASSWGGAVRIRVGGHACTFNECVFDGNGATYDSGCLVIDDGAVVLLNECEFTGNSGSGNGGAITVNSTSTVTINGGTFSGNESNSGGVIYLKDGTTTTLNINGGSFSENEATNGGVIYVKGGSTSINIAKYNTTPSSFQGNAVTSDGGVIYVAAGTGTIDVDDAIFKGNSASDASGEGGVFRLESGTPELTLDNCTFGGTLDGDPNYSGMDGGALSLRVGTTTITNCNFVGNYALNNDATRTTGNGYGGAIDCFDSAVMTINGGTFSRNNAWQGGAINCSSTGTVSLNGTTFNSNGNNEKTRYGGAIRVNATMNFTGCTFGGNSASDGNIASIGGALYIESKTTTIDGCEFSHNVANTTDDNFGGGAIFVSTNKSAGITLTIKGTSKRSEFNYNSTGSCGGAICGWHPSVDTQDNTLTIQDSCLFVGNHASKWAGAILFKNRGSMTVTDSRFTGNYADADSGAFNGDNNNTTFNFNGVIFSGNHADGDHGGVMWIARGTYNITSCIFNNNHTANDKWGGAVYAIDDGKVRFWKCQFNGNYAASGGAVFGKDDNNRYPTLFFDCCSFDGNFIKDAWGTTIYAYKAQYFCMNNCSFANNTYLDNTSSHDGLKASWIYLQSIRNDILFSNCTLIGRAWYKDGNGDLQGTYSYNGLIGLENGNDTKVTTYLVNSLFLLDNGGGSHFHPIRGWYQEDGKKENIEAHYVHYSKAFDNVVLTEYNSHTGNYKEHTRNGTGSNEASWEGTYWKWNGTYSWNGTYDKINKTDFINYLDTACSRFVSWLGSEDIGKDCLGNSRGETNWRPGAYQGN